MKEGWETMRLGDAATFINGYPFKPEQWGNGGLPIIRIQNLNNPSAEYNYYSGIIPDKYFVRNGDILISWSASLGAYEWDKGDAYLNQHIFKVKFDKKDIDKHFLRYAVIGRLAEMEKDAHGATMRHIVKKDFDNTPIPDIPLAEQEKIVAELDLLSSVIEKKKEQLKELDNLAQSIFYDMFGDPIANEKGWETKMLKEGVEQMFLGPFGSSLKTECYVDKANSYCMVYEQKHAIKKSLHQDNHYIDKDKYLSLQRFEVLPGDIIMSCRGTIGEIYQLPADAPMGIIHPSLMKIRLKSDFYNSVFFKTILRKIVANEDTNGGCVQMAITAKALGNRHIIYPPLDLQNTFSQKIDAIEQQKSLIRKSIEEAEALFNSRMDYYFN